jgi:hypothetical protein
MIDDIYRKIRVKNQMDSVPATYKQFTFAPHYGPVSAVIARDENRNRAYLPSNASIVPIRMPWPGCPGKLLILNFALPQDGHDVDISAVGCHVPVFSALIATVSHRLMCASSRSVFLIFLGKWT